MWSSFMDPITAGLITGGSSLLGSIFSANTSASNVSQQIAAQQGMQTQSEAFNAEQAQLNRSFQETMSNTAYQRASKDMKSAGLNPMMMFGSGGPASVPGGSSASVGTPSVPPFNKTSPFAGIGDAVSKALNSAITAKTFDKMTQEIANLQTQQAQTAAQTITEQERPPLVRAQSRETAATAKLKELGVSAGEVGAREAKAILAIPDWLHDTLVQGGFIGRKASDVIDPLATGLSSATGVGRFLGSVLGPSKNVSIRRTGSDSWWTNKSGNAAFEDRFRGGE